MNTTRNATLAATFLGLLAAASLPASAESITEVTANAVTEQTAITVSYEDLDLNSAKGMETLHYRIASAAREACGSADMRRVGGLGIANRNQACYEVSVSAALAAIPTSQVAASR